MNLTFPGAMPKISFLRPVSRENFGNALGMTSIHDLTVRLNDEDEDHDYSIIGDDGPARHNR